MKTLFQKKYIPFKNRSFGTVYHFHLLDIERTEMNSYPDEDSISLGGNDEIEAFDIIIERYKEHLFDFIAYFLNDFHQTQNIVQEAFLRLLRMRNTFNKKMNISVTLFSIAHDLLKNEIRREKWRSSLSDLASHIKIGGMYHARFDYSQSVEKIMADHAIRETIYALPVLVREAVILRDIERMSYDDIASITHSGVNKVKSRVAEARKRMQRMLSVTQSSIAN